jgi:hypothetical protein
MPLSAPEARTRIKQRVTVEMPVKAAKNCQRCSLMCLDSEEDHHDAKIFAVAITESGSVKWPGSNHPKKATFSIVHEIPAVWELAFTTACRLPPVHRSRDGSASSILMAGC